MLDAGSKTGEIPQFLKREGSFVFILSPKLVKSLVFMRGWVF